MRLQRRITTAARCRTRYSSRRLVVGAKSGKTYSAATLTAFGEDFTHHCPPPPTFSTSSSFFTGKPVVEGLGHAFLMRNYRAGLGKWQTADPMGYPDGWNQLAYCGNGVTGAVDLWGCVVKTVNLDITTQWQYDDGNGGTTGIKTSVGYPILNVFNHMKDKWEQGTAVMNILGIKTAADLEKMAKGKLNGKTEEKIKKIFDDGLWFEDLVKNAGMGYQREEPLQSEIEELFKKKVGSDMSEVVIIEIVKNLERIDPDMYVVDGQKFVVGCDQIWKVTVKYE